MKIQNRVQSYIDTFISSHEEIQEFEDGFVFWYTITRKMFYGKNRFVVTAKCKRCNKTRELAKDNLCKLVKTNSFTGMCKACQCKTLGKDSSNWKGGRYTNKRGYIIVCIDPSHEFFCMANTSNNVAEHRLVMANHLCRPLKSTEHVHHINGNKSDNRIENLQLVSPSEHCLITMLENRISLLEKLLQENNIQVPQ